MESDATAHTADHRCLFFADLLTPSGGGCPYSTSQVWAATALGSHWLARVRFANVCLALAARQLMHMVVGLDMELWCRAVNNCACNLKRVSSSGGGGWMGCHDPSGLHVFSNPNRKYVLDLEVFFRNISFCLFMLLLLAHVMIIPRGALSSCPRVCFDCCP